MKFEEDNLEYDWCKENYSGDDGFIYGSTNCERC